MGEYVWSEMRDPFIEHVGATPSGAVEQRIIDVFTQHPKLVEQAIAHIGERYDRGLIRSPWPVLALQCEELRDKLSATGDVHASDRRDRAKARERGARWIKATGIHFDREAEVADELFGHFGMLRDYADDAQLRDELLTLWAAERPRGERCEAEALERMRVQGEHYRRQHEPRPPVAAPAATDNPFLA